MISGNCNGNLIDEDAKWVQLGATDPDFGCWDPMLYKDGNQHAHSCRNISELVVHAWDVLKEQNLCQALFARLDLSQVATSDLIANKEAVSTQRK